jgi:hypothetical protein
MTQRYRRDRVTLTAHLREAMAAGEIAPMSDATLDREARLMDAVLDGIGLQWLLDPSTDMVSCVDDYVTDAMARWQRPRYERRPGSRRRRRGRCDPRHVDLRLWASALPQSEAPLNWPVSGGDRSP